MSVALGRAFVRLCRLRGLSAGLNCTSCLPGRCASLLYGHNLRGLSFRGYVAAGLGSCAAVALFGATLCLLGSRIGGMCWRMMAVLFQVTKQGSRGLLRWVWELVGVPSRWSDTGRFRFRVDKYS